MNEFITKISSFDLNGREVKLLFTVIGITWQQQGRAWGEARWRYLTEATNITAKNLGIILTRMKSRNIIHTKPGTKYQKYKINSKLSTWKTFEEIQKPPLKLKVVETDQTTFKNEGTPPSKLKVVPPSKLKVDTYIKENIKKTNKDTPPKPPSEKPNKPAKKKSAAKPKEKEGACSLPAFFQLSMEMERYALNKGIDVEKVDDFFESFLNWASAKGIQCVDWEAQFKTHVDNAPQFGRQYLLKTPKRK